jgi:hypothetical protein
VRVFPFFILLACNTASPWTNAPQLFPERQNHAVVTNGSVAFVVGGVSASGVTLDLFASYTPPKVIPGGWTALPALPVALHHANVCALGDNVFVLGGFNALGADSICLRYSIPSQVWSECTRGSQRAAAACVVAGERLYLFGGVRDDAVVADAQEYDPATDTWRELPQLPVARSHMGAVFLRGQLHVIGGRTTGLVPTGRVDTYDPVTRTWSEGPRMLVPRSDYAISSDGVTALIFGGEGNSSDPLGIFAAVERYDGAVFTRLADMPHARHGMGAAYIVTELKEEIVISGIKVERTVLSRKEIFLPGGAEIAGVAPTSHHDFLTQ